MAAHDRFETGSCSPEHLRLSGGKRKALVVVTIIEIRPFRNGWQSVRESRGSARMRTLKFVVSNVQICSCMKITGSLRSDLNLSHDRSRRLFRCRSGLFSRADYPRTAQSAGSLRG